MLNFLAGCDNRRSVILNQILLLLPIKDSPWAWFGTIKALSEDTDVWGQLLSSPRDHSGPVAVRCTNHGYQRKTEPGATGAAGWSSCITIKPSIQLIFKEYISCFAFQRCRKGHLIMGASKTIYFEYMVSKPFKATANTLY